MAYILHTKRKRVIAGLCMLIWIAIALSGCQCNGPVIRSQESFMLAFQDRDERVWVRWSENGQTWSLATLENAGTDRGVAAAADQLGIVRLIAYPHLAVGLSLRFGIGADAWDTSSLILESDEAGNRVRVSSALSVVYARAGRWLIAFKPYNTDKVKVVTYDSGDKKLLAQERTPPSFTSLVDRGGGLIYDRAQNITWIQNAGLAFQQHGGGLEYYEAIEWANSLSYFDQVRNVTWDDWRLPRTPIPDTTCGFSQSDWVQLGCTGGELGHLWHISLGLEHGDPLEGAFVPFTNVHIWGGYWYSNEPWMTTANQESACGVRFLDGETSKYLTHTKNSAWAVRDGDVAGESFELNNSLILGRPAMVNRNGKIVLSWLRNTSPRQLQIVVGNIDNAGDPNWTRAYLFQLTEPGFSHIVSEPSLTHDHSRFYLGVVRKADGVEANTLFIYSSSDGIAWQLSDQLPDLPFSQQVPTRVQIAAHSDGTMIAAFTGVTPGVHRRGASGWYQLNNTGVFGSVVPAWQPLALISVGRPQSE